VIRIFALFLICFFSTTVGLTQTIDKIEFKGLTKTDPIFLTKFIESEVGQPLDTMAFNRDIQNLKNLNLFFSVIGEYHKNESGGIHLLFDIEEAKYLYPIVTEQIKLIFWGERNQLAHCINSMIDTLLLFFILLQGILIIKLDTN